MPEIVDEGVTGFVVDSIEQAVAAVAEAASLDRGTVRAVFERRFSADRMARDYEAVYAGLVDAAAAAAMARATARPPDSVIRSNLKRRRRHDTAERTPTRSRRRAGRDRRAAPREPHRQFALKHEDCFVVADGYGDIRGTGDGLFRDDTRVLSRFRLFVGGRMPSLLGASLSQDNILFTANLTNLPLTAPGRQ